MTYFVVAVTQANQTMLSQEMYNKLRNAKYPGWDLPEFPMPTLSELIEACGHNFWILQRDPITDTFVASFDDYNEEGKTPEEAVARLWLALNKS